MNKYRLITCITLIIIAIIVLLCVNGCSASDMEYDTYIDKDTCIVYLTRYHGGVTPMYNQDGTLKLDKKCLKEER